MGDSHFSKGNLQNFAKMRKMDTPAPIWLDIGDSLMDFVAVLLLSDV